MKPADVKIGNTYYTEVSGNETQVRITADLGYEHPPGRKKRHRGFRAINTETNRVVTKTPGKLYTEPKRQREATKAAKTQENPVASQILILMRARAIDASKRGKLRASPDYIRSFTERHADALLRRMPRKPKPAPPPKRTPAPRRPEPTRSTTRASLGSEGDVIETFERSSQYMLRRDPRDPDRWFISGPAGLLATAETDGPDIESVTWHSDEVRPTEQEGLEKRLEFALQFAHKRQDPVHYEVWRHEMIAELAQQARALGADPERTMTQDGGDEYQWLAEMLQEFSLAVSDHGALPRWVMKHGGLDLGFEELDPDDSAHSRMLTLWDQVEDTLGVDVVQRMPNGSYSVDSRAVMGTGDDLYVAVYSSYTEGTAPQLRLVPAKQVDCSEDEEEALIQADEGRMCVEPREGTLEVGEKTLGLDRTRFTVETAPEFFTRMHAFEAAIRNAPAQLDDVRELLLWAGALVDTPRCQGQAKHEALVGIRRAKSEYDDAVAALREGRADESLKGAHFATLQLARTAVDLARSCAEGQTELLFGDEPAQPEDEGPGLEGPEPSRYIGGEPNAYYVMSAGSPEIPSTNLYNALRQFRMRDKDVSPVPIWRGDLGAWTTLDTADRTVDRLAQDFAILRRRRTEDGLEVILGTRKAEVGGIFAGIPKNKMLVEVTITDEGVPSPTDYNWNELPDPLQRPGNEVRRMDVIRYIERKMDAARVRPVRGADA